MFDVFYIFRENFGKIVEFEKKKVNKSNLIINF